MLKSVAKRLLSTFAKTWYKEKVELAYWKNRVRKEGTLTNDHCRACGIVF